MDFLSKALWLLIICLYFSYCFEYAENPKGIIKFFIVLPGWLIISFAFLAIIPFFIFLLIWPFLSGIG